MPARIIERTIAGPGVLRGGVAGEHEDAGADDRADPEHRQVDRAERALQPVLGVLHGVHQLVDRLGGEEPTGHPGLLCLWFVRCGLLGFTFPGRGAWYRPRIIREAMLSTEARSVE